MLPPGLPPGLRKPEVPRCPCHTRTSVGHPGGLAYGPPANNPAIIRVNECLFPMTWNGRQIVDPEAEAERIRKEHQTRPKARGPRGRPVPRVRPPELPLAARLVPLLRRPRPLT